MPNVTAKAANKTDNLPRKSSADHIALHLSYRQIGISAVAAAARYQGAGRNQAYAPVAVKLDEPAGAV
jgi:hypothetical protein